MAYVDLAIKNHCAVITLNRPEQRNTLTAEMCLELVQTTNRIETDNDVKVMVVTGSGPAFCAGADLGDLLAAGRGEGEKLKQIYAGFQAIADARLPTIAAINGPAVGAGMNLALACDIRLVSESARLDTRFLNIGIHPGGGHTWMLHRQVNWQTASAMLLLGDVVSAEEAVRLGLAWRCLPDDQLLEATLDYAANAAKTPRELLIKTKSTLQETRWVRHQQEALDLEYEKQVWSLQQPEASEFLTAMFEKIRAKR